MSTFMMVLTLVSLAGLLVISVYRFTKLKNRRRFIIQLLIISICLGALYFFWWSPKPTGKITETSNVYFVIVLYLFMLLGMLAQYVYTRFTQPKQEREKFDWGLFIAPVFASPIVFIPLLAALQNAEVDLQHLTTTRMMVFFVAFENGFFWKEYFDHRRKEKQDGTVEKVQLPTEAQWEKAARGTDGRIWPWGNEWDANKCNNSETGAKQTTPVGNYPQGASPYGLMDIAGNVLEWCADWYDENYYASAPDRNPPGVSSGTWRVLRGGSWVDFSGIVRVAGRRWVTDNGDVRLGFRCTSPRFP